MAMASALCRAAIVPLRCPSRILVHVRTKVAAAFVQNGVVPDVVQKPPGELLKVSFASGAKVDLGNELTPTQVKSPPNKVEWTADKDSLYTLVMTDPDAPSRAEPTFREWHHWLVVNVPGKNLKKGDHISEYIGSGPPPDTGLHRYVYLVYKQPGKIHDKEHGKLTNRSGERRNNFRVALFSKKHNLELVAGNFYQAQFDDYVPELYKQLGA